MRKARIIKLIGGWYTIQDLESNKIFDSKASGKLRYVRLDEDSSFNKQITKRTKKDIKIVQLAPKVGDMVMYDDTDIHKPIQEILPRENELNRPDVANVDQILLLFSTVKPDFSFNLLDQFLVLVEKSHIRPVIIISKIDLIKEEALSVLKDKLSYYEKIGYPVYYVNSFDAIGFSVLKDIFKEKVTVLAGQTGVGKSTFINALMPDLNLKTGETSEALGRGRHTTRHTELFFYRDGLIADTPGFSKLEFEIFDESELKRYFVEFDQFKSGCQFGNSCNHVHEPKCSVKDNKNILKTRIENYHKFYSDIKNQKERY